ncbi:MAG TPA: hypothetical protein VK966_06285 [Longimicrobiales bacterium]|nr:hypothetical protein [Longimicrobiales bacterium]
MKPTRTTRFAARSGLFLIAVSLLFSGCDDAFGPQPWGFFPDTADLYSLARPEYIGQPGAYDFLNLAPVVVEAIRGVPASFDVAITEAADGTFRLVPGGAFTGFSITPGLVVDSTGTFEGIEEAPRDGYTVDEPLVADTTVVYIVRSRDAGTRCVRYGKLEVLELRDDGVAVIRAIRNPNCNDRDLVPTAETDD